MSGRWRTVAIVTVLVLVVAGLGLGFHRLWNDWHRSNFSRALDVVPASTLRLSFTDWTAVRRELGIDPGSHPDDAAVTSLLSRAYDSDLSGVSSIDEAGVALQKYFGFSPATLDWEAYAQGRSGATMVARVPDGFDLGAVQDKLAGLGFKRPATPDGVWNGGVDLVSAIDSTITPELQYVAVLADQRLIVTSDQPGYAATAAAVASGHGSSLADSSAPDLVGTLPEPAAAMLWTGDFACSDLAMSQASADDQAAASALIAKAGKITPLTGLVMALDTDRTLRVAEQFQSSGEAGDNLVARARLAVGDAPGRGGPFSDNLRLLSSSTSGATVQLRFAPTTGSGFVLSGLDNGPVLFASC